MWYNNYMDLLNMNLAEIEEAVVALNLPRFRARQLFDWLYKGATSFDEMKNLPSDIKRVLGEHFLISSPKVLREQKSKEDGTRKFLLEYSDGNAIETVFMKYKYGNSICVSSQAGCRMGCKFCASTVNGLSRNLTAGEILAQILVVEKEVRKETESDKSTLNTGRCEDAFKKDNAFKKDDSFKKDNILKINNKDWRINHIVIMGTGEPFDNYDNISKFLRLVHDPKGLNISMRNITVSTCGLVPMIERFADDFPAVNLAISLHATTDEMRSSMMPINNKYPLSELIPAAKEYTKKTNRRITFEYTMVSGVNDKDEDAIRLAGMLKGMLCHVNVIPLNRVEGSGFDTVSRKRAMEFAGMLENKGITATVRRELGADIDAACGQLRLKNATE